MIWMIGSVQRCEKNGKFCVENVTPYYEPLIPGVKIGRHIYWTNFNLSGIAERKAPKNMIEYGSVDVLSEFHNYDFRQYKGEQGLKKIARNLVDYKVGKDIFSKAFNCKIEDSSEQISLL